MMIGRLSRWWRAIAQKRREARMWERKIIVCLDDRGISATYPPSAKLPDGKTYAIGWSDVRCVAIETNDSGPWGADFWYLVEGDNQLCAFPQGATGELAAISEFPKKLPSFDFELVMKAVSWTSNARFVCWKRGASQ
jgi:hypothetical protein